ncbi:MAG: D-serine ammonia-lyase [Clostridiales bacterium]|nr:D-serine ammonia-lyase [Candidatus Crickella caballi]
MSAYLEKLKNAEEVVWINPEKLTAEEGLARIEFSEADIDDAAARLVRFAPLIEKMFPETSETGGIIESPLTEIEAMKDVLNAEGAELEGRLFLKRDSDLKVSGSVKARGGIYEVLKHSEDLAIESGLLTGYDDDYTKLASDEAREFFSRYKIQVGSTGNLGMSIGIMSAALGYNAIVHMSMDAKQWKKDLLRQRGATVIEYDGDYGAAVVQGRTESDADPMSYFVDDENSSALFLGYAVAAKRIEAQFKEQGVTVDDEHPLFVYIPCGVGGAPGGVTFGMKVVFGDNAHCFFVEPTQCPCMVVGLETGKMSDICVQDIGLTGLTEADGLAVGRPSGLVSRFMKLLLSGEFTVDDEKLNPYLRKLWKNEGIYIEPSACATFIGPARMCSSTEGKKYIADNELEAKMANATHVVWATGGSMVPQEIREKLLNE